MLILASASPRRRELLGLIAAGFTVDVSEVPENLPDDIDPAAAVEELSLRKALAVAARHGPADTVIGSDTVVVLDGKILGKPGGREDAARMLRSLAGRAHEVLTGVAVLRGSDRAVFHSSARVFFAPMKEEEISAYLDTGEPFDKAGAYGIQGYGARYIERVEGDYSAVVGLPVHMLYRVMRDMAVI